ncbi:MAG: diaminopimelate decarboxylase [Vicinamibacterales bacterium]|nr:diaminopimelate decarboxylase [Vicinamibacterales bacterium]
MSGFFREGNALMCDGVPLEDVARTHGTPVYVYSAESVRRAYRSLDEAFGAHPHRIHYALKANSSLAIVRLLRSLGSGVDANSIGEIELAMRAGFSPVDIVFTGVGKSPDEIDRAVQLGLKAINAESAGELDRIDRAARAHGVRARVAVRVNPDIDAGTHPHVSTGLHINKFGVPLEHARALYHKMSDQPGLEPVGIHVHLGSQIVTLEPMQRAAATVVKMVQELRQAGVTLDHIDVGGGLGISYDGSRVPSAAEYARSILSVLGPSGLSIAMEPGRFLVGASAALLARVVDLKDGAAGHHFAVLDAGMTELIRPALYGSFHRIEAVTPRQARELCYDIVGPICESSDAFGEARKLPALEVGDLLAILDAGAYGSAMASNYNRHSLPAEVMIDGGEARLTRRRQTLDDQLSLEIGG